MIKLVVSGPANGSVAFAFPEFKREDDDSIFLPSSDFELVQGAIVFRLTRTWATGVPHVRVSLFKQVHEPHMTRLGHAFGATFEISEKVGSGSALAETLLQLIDVIELHCCQAGHFCDDARFLAFLEAEIAPSFEGIAEQVLKNESNRIVVGTKLAPGLGQRVCLRTTGISPAHVGQVLEWFCFDAGSVLCEALLVAPDKSGSCGRTFVETDSLSDVSAQSSAFIYKSYVDVARSLEDANRARQEAAAQLDALRRQLEILKTDEAIASDRASIFERQNVQLHKKVRLLEQGSSPVANVNWQAPATTLNRMPPYQLASAKAPQVPSTRTLQPAPVRPPALTASEAPQMPLTPIRPSAYGYDPRSSTLPIRAASRREPLVDASASSPWDLWIIAAAFLIIVIVLAVVAKMFLI